METAVNSRERDKRVLAALWAKARDKSITPEERLAFTAKANQVSERLRASEPQSRADPKVEQAFVQAFAKAQAQRAQPEPKPAPEPDKPSDMLDLRKWLPFALVIGGILGGSLLLRLAGNYPGEAAFAVLIALIVGNLIMSSRRS